MSSSGPLFLHCYSNLFSKSSIRFSSSTCLILRGSPMSLSATGRRIQPHRIVLSAWTPRLTRTGIRRIRRIMCVSLRFLRVVIILMGTRKYPLIVVFCNEYHSRQDSPLFREVLRMGLRQIRLFSAHENAREGMALPQASTRVQLFRLYAHSLQRYMISSSPTIPSSSSAIEPSSLTSHDGTELR